MSQNEPTNHFDEYTPLDTASLPDVNLAQLMKGHVWKQHGNFVECTSCTYTHGMMVHGHEKITSQQGGMPIIEKQL